MTDSLTENDQEKMIAVVGAGYWGVNHVRNFYEIGALGVICDSNITALHSLSERFPEARIESDFNRVIADEQVKGVVIATPAEYHYRMARAAIEAGKDVLVEKPLTLELGEAESLVNLARSRNAILMVGHLLEYHPAVIRLRELIASGSLGSLRYIYSTRANLGKIRREENILWSFAPHDIAIILRLAGEQPVNVSATGSAYLQPHIADVTVTHLEFPSGVRAHIFVSWLHPYKEQRMVVIGSERMAVFDDVRKEDKLLVYDQGVEFINGLPVTRKNEAVAEALPIGEPLKSECLHFIECIDTRRKPLTDGESGLRVLEVLSAAQESLSAGGQPLIIG